ncbi:hypothetical protein B296_00024363 [Ensete ventricosum]|uniref:Uncharacterized protein n=1 Tax=Ensete ventricosum TaxID=4639 RepID=A0A426Y5F4_ENSVE|nr:hypothetical protein B296_00024363 [Ensete ventricosum]
MVERSWRWEDEMKPRGVEEMRLAVVNKLEEVESAPVEEVVVRRQEEVDSEQVAMVVNEPVEAEVSSTCVTSEWAARRRGSQPRPGHGQDLPTAARACPQGGPAAPAGVAARRGDAGKQERSARKALLPTASPIANRGDDAGHRGGRPLAGLPVGKGSCCLRRGSGDSVEGARWLGHPFEKRMILPL